uniref:Uncharacterized protein n=1 Tax=Oncorhynchus mykiss TaxID=8022 RepID=A0A8C7W7Q7_ONCMY
LLGKNRFEAMMLYLSFPVTMFWISNQAEYFEEYILSLTFGHLHQMALIGLHVTQYMYVLFDKVQISIHKS